MKSRRFRTGFLTLAVILGFSTLALARYEGRGARFGKKLAHCLETAGVDSARADALIAQVRSHKAELVSMWQEHKSALTDLAAMSPDQGSAVTAKVQTILDAHMKNRATFRGIIDEVAAQLAPREKAAVVLHIADRLEGFAGRSRFQPDRVAERLADHELVTPAEAASIEIQLEASSPEIATLREDLKAGVQKLRSAVSDSKTSDADIEALLAQMRQNRETAGNLRHEAMHNVIAQLSPASQIAIAGKLVRVQQAAEVLLGF